MTDPLAVIVSAVAEAQGFTSDDLIGYRRPAGLIHARHTAMFFCRMLTTASYPQIAQHFGGRDHTTALHACRKIGADYDKHPDRYARVREAVTVALEGGKA